MLSRREALAALGSAAALPLVSACTHDRAANPAMSNDADAHRNELAGPECQRLIGAQHVLDDTGGARRRADQLPFVDVAGHGC